MANPRKAREPVGNGPARRHRPRYGNEDDAEDERRQWACRRDEELVTGVRRLTLDLGRSPENEQPYSPHTDAPPNCDHRMAELVHQNARKEKDASCYGYERQRSRRDRVESTREVDIQTTT